MNRARRDAKSLSMQATSGQIDQIDLKYMLENLRSVLDYLAQDIALNLKKLAPHETHPKKIYFPYGKEQNSFQTSIKQNMPTFQRDLPLLYTLIENIQPFKAHDNWLFDLCYLTNNAKHNGLSKTETETSVSINYPGAIHISGAKGSVVFTGNMVNGRRLDDVKFDGKSVQRTKRDLPLQTTTDNKISFLDKQIEIVPFIKKCIEEITKLVAGAESFL